MRDHPLLRVRGLRARIDSFQILHGIDFDVPAGATTVVLGRNGAGKTTTLRSLMGYLPGCEGTVALDGQDLLGLPVFRIARSGVAYVPEDRGILGPLSVEENLRVSGPSAAAWDSVLERFPVVRQRLRSRAGDLSGGQQQMLAVARALMCEPRLLVLDEPTKGLAPLAVEELVETIRGIQADMTVLLVEQNVKVARDLGRHFAVIEDGTTVASGSFDGSGDDWEQAERHLTLAGAIGGAR